MLFIGPFLSKYLLILLKSGGSLIIFFSSSDFSLFSSSFSILFSFSIFSLFSILLLLLFSILLLLLTFLLLLLLLLLTFLLLLILLFSLLFSCCCSSIGFGSGKSIFFCSSYKKISSLFSLKKSFKFFFPSVSLSSLYLCNLLLNLLSYSICFSS